MEPLEKINLWPESHYGRTTKINEIIDRLNELSGSKDCRHCEVAETQGATHIHTPKRFKAEDIHIEETHGLTRLSLYCSEAEAQAALEALLNL